MKIKCVAKVVWLGFWVFEGATKFWKHLRIWTLLASAVCVLFVSQLICTIRNTARGFGQCGQRFWPSKSDCPSLIQTMIKTSVPSTSTPDFTNCWWSQCGCSWQVSLLRLDWKSCLQMKLMAVCVCHPLCHLSPPHHQFWSIVSGAAACYHKINLITTGCLETYRPCFSFFFTLWLQSINLCPLMELGETPTAVFASPVLAMFTSMHQRLSDNGRCCLKPSSFTHSV